MMKERREAIEVPFGHKLIPITSFFLSVVCASVSTLLGMDNDIAVFRFAFMVFMLSFFSFPYFMRSLLCRNWKLVDSKIISQEDMSSPHIHWRGVSYTISIRITVEYFYRNICYVGTTTAWKEVSQKKEIYCNPKHPEWFCQKKNIGLLGALFPLLIVVLSFLKFLTYIR